MKTEQAKKRVRRCKYGDEIMCVKTFRCTKAQADMLKALGGIGWLRELLNAELEKKSKKMG